MSRKSGKIALLIIVALFLLSNAPYAFAQMQYYLTLEADPPFILDIDPDALTGEGWYNSGDIATFSAKPVVIDWYSLTRWEFIEWTTAYGEPTYLDNPAEWFMDGGYTFVANYGHLSYYLNVTTDPPEVQAIDPSAVSGEGWYYSGSFGIVDAKQTVMSGPYRYEFVGWVSEDQYYDEDWNPKDLPGNQAAHFMDGAFTMIAVYEVFIDVDWEYSFVDDARGTTLKISIDDGFFQFSSSGKDFAVKQADGLIVRGGLLTLWHSDSDLNIAAFAILNGSIDFCLATARDAHTGQVYLLRDKIGLE